MKNTTFCVLVLSGLFAISIDAQSLGAGPPGYANGVKASTQGQARNSAFDPGFNFPLLFPKAPGGPLRPPTAFDWNPNPRIVEVVLVAYEADILLPGMPRSIRMYTYNGSVPGPTIEAEIGDRLIVHFLNLLPEETTIHWHGVETPATMDGSHISQLLVQPGETFLYDFRLNKDSLFWYHPHVRTNEQVEKGLHGLLLVRNSKRDQALGLPTAEHLLVLDDIRLGRDGQIAPPFDTANPLQNALDHVNGRTSPSSPLLVNGRHGPSATIRADVPHRFRVVNVSNSKFMRLSVSDHDLYRIGGDGGLLETPLAIGRIDTIPDPLGLVTRRSDPDPTKGILLTPGERADFIVSPRTNEELVLEWHDIWRGRHTSYYLGGQMGLDHDDFDGRYARQDLIRLIPVGRPLAQDYVPPESLRELDAVDPTGAPTFTVTFGHGNPDLAGEITLFALMPGGVPKPFPLVTPVEAPDFTIGDTVVWEINNLTFGTHNFHTHGWGFQHIETQFVDAMTPANNYTVPAAYLEEKDTIQIAARPGAKGSSRSITRVAMKFTDAGREGRAAASGRFATETTSGGWLFHCHILEHSASGMMGFFEVFNP